MRLADLPSRRLALLVALLAWPAWVNCGQPPAPQILLQPPPAEDIHVVHVGSEGGVGRVDVVPPPPAAPFTVTATAIEPSDDEVQPILDFDGLGFSSTVLARNFGGRGQAIGGLSFSHIVPHGVSETASVAMRQVLEFEANTGAVWVTVRSDAQGFGPSGDLGGSLDATCFDLATPLSVTTTAMPLGAEATLFLTMSQPVPITMTARCNVDLSAASAANSEGLSGHVISYAVKTLASPRALNEAPVASPIFASFDPSTFQTVYHVNAYDPDGPQAQATWSGPDCATFGSPPTDPFTFFWIHPHPPCDPTQGHEHVTIRVDVSDGLETVRCEYQGALSGVGPPCQPLP